MSSRSRRERLLALGALCALSFGGLGCIPDGALKHENTTVPAALDDGWPVATPAAVGLDPAVLANIHRQLLAEDRFVGTLGVLVIKDGQLVWETYLRDPADRDRHQHVQSVTKSFTSLAFGAAWDDGLFPSLDARLDAYLPDDLEGLGPERAAITLRDLLTMRSGLAFDNDDFSVEMWVDKPAHPVRYMLSKSLYAAPGTTFYYRDVDPQLLGYVLQKVVGESEERWARRRLFEPLGIKDYFWDRGPDGVSMAAHGLHVRPRDLAKLGQVLLDGGTWQGRRLISAAWLAEATTRFIDPVPGDGAPSGSGYGFYFWLLPDGEGVAGWGHGGQFVLAIPAQHLVLVQVALPDAELHGSDLRQFYELMKPLFP
jgi:CubicO group peptidase (beta-lactamase class C family)